jgi:P27 family predicted phage terminase small subunit
VPLLAELGLVSRIDRTTLAAYCVAAGKLVATARVLESEGLTIESPVVHKGEVVCHRTKPHPAVSIQKEALQQVKAYLTEFGLSPAARTRIKVAPKEEKEDELTAFLRGKKGGAG